MPSLKDLPSLDRPRERLQMMGAENLSIAELMAIIISSGTRGKSALDLAQEILSTFKPLEKLIEVSIEELSQIKGLGETKAIKLKAALTLSQKCIHISKPKPKKITHPNEAYYFIKNILDVEQREVFLALLLDSKCQHISTEVISIGTLNQTLIHPREVFYPAIRQKAAFIILSHNHPSGDPTPSKEDLELTSSLVQSGKLLEIPIKDHLVVGNNRYISLREFNHQLF
tara:strand:+ start:1266 stop:1949 length:684 start_codon:yes stop_codon:yes gene_type:complete